MAILTYDSKGLGYFSVVADTNLFNQIIDNSTALSYFPWTDVKAPIMTVVGYELKDEVKNYALRLNVVLNPVYVPSVAFETTYTLYENRQILAIGNSKRSHACYFVTDGVRATSTDNVTPIGTSGNDASSASINFLLCNDDLSECKVVWLGVYPFLSNVSRRIQVVVRTLRDFNAATYFLNIKPVILPNPDPYTKGSGSHSGGGGGTGKFSRTGDTIGEHNVPTLSAVDAGFITLFAPTAGEMKALASYLWSDLFSIDTFKKIFANPMDAILGLSIVPVAVPTSGSASVKVGNISTGVSMTKASTQYVKLSCGSLEVEEYWGAYLDYSPYTKCEIYLPYIGVHELSVDDVMGKTVKVVYYIDILSGACTAEIYSNSTCLYSFVGQCSASIPITGNDWTNVINGVMQIGASIGSMVASGGLTAPISAGGVVQGLKSVASASSTVTSSKPSVERSGSMSGAGGMLGQQTPYIIITWPRECIPADQNKYIGYPSYVTVNLGEIVGFNIIESIHLENIPATSTELDEIESLLMNGVIF